MEKILRKKLTKKGFTLAELLIVVAIITVLVAIAAPLFIGALDKAKEATFNANMRAIRAAGVAEILTNYDKYAATSAGGDATFWTVKATVSATGEIGPLTITVNGTDPESTWATKKSDGVTGEYIVKITELTAS